MDVRLRSAIEAVAEAGRLATAVQHGIAARGDRVLKEDRSPVTVADLAAQAIITASLQRDFPSIPLMAEEDARPFDGPGGGRIREEVLALVADRLPGITPQQLEDLLGRGGHPGGPTGTFWVLDPIDGTKGFLRGDQFAIALALIAGGRVELGVVGCPNLPTRPGDSRSERGAIFAAMRGEGAEQMTRDGRPWAPISVDDVSDPAAGAFCESVESAHSSHGATARVAALLGITAPPYRVDGQTKYAIVARGEASLYLRLPTRPGYREKIWDHAAGSLLVTEAGGRVTHVDGGELDFGSGRTLPNGTGIVVSNGRLHGAVLVAVRQVMAES